MTFPNQKSGRSVGLYFVFLLLFPFFIFLHSPFQCVTLKFFCSFYLFCSLSCLSLASEKTSAQALSESRKLGLPVMCKFCVSFFFSDKNSGGRGGGLYRDIQMVSDSRK